MMRAKPRKIILVGGVVFIFSLFSASAFAKKPPANKDIPAKKVESRGSPVIPQPSPQPEVAVPARPLAAPTRSEVRKPPLIFKVNPPVKVKNSSFQVLAGRKEPNSAIYINRQEVISKNPYTSWYYEYPLNSGVTNLTLGMSFSTPKVKLASTLTLDLNKDSLNLDAEAPRISGIRFDPATKDIILTIQDSPGVLSYNIYYANDLNSLPPNSCFILAQQDFPVSGSGTTTWRDNGTFTKIHPKNVKMRFYKLEMSRIDNTSPIITISEPLEAEVVTEP
jgi:hypothetical protein